MWGVHVWGRWSTLFSDNPDPTSAELVGILPSCPIVTTLPVIIVTSIITGITVPGTVAITVRAKTAPTCAHLLPPSRLPLSSSQQVVPHPWSSPAWMQSWGSSEWRVMITAAPEPPALCLSRSFRTVVLSRASGNRRKQRSYLWQCLWAKYDYRLSKEANITKTNICWLLIMHNLI